MIPLRRQGLSSGAALILTAGVTASGQPSGYSTLWDDFSRGFSVAPAAGAKWFYFSAGPFVGNDGTATTSNKGLDVSSPQFSLTLGQEGSIENPYSLPGGLDHVKWLVYANHSASSLFPGFDAVAGQELQFDTWISGESFGNALNPFGSAVTDPDDDVRLATPAMNTIDFETLLVADFFMTNRRIYAVYERLPFGRGVAPNGVDYAAFTYAIPVARRMPHQQHHLTIAYNRSARTIRWLIGDVEVFRVTRPGYRLTSREFMILDHGGLEEDVDCRQRDVGFGVFTLLDAASPSQIALVKLSVTPNLYYSTATGALATDAYFVDPLSLPGSRIWGEGTELQVSKVRVSSR